MKRLALFVFALSSAVPCAASPVATNAVSGIVSVTASTNAPTAKSTFVKASEVKRPRHP